MLEIKDLHIEYVKGHEVLKGVDLSVDKGEVVAIVGPSGSGKTTMLRCISFLEKAKMGQMNFAGELIDMATASREQIRKVRMEMGYVFQSFNLFKNMTALENVMEGQVKARKINKEEAKAKSMEVLEKVGMADRADYYPDELSGGQQQRVAIARAVALNPQVILFDEPTSALDPELTQEVLDVMRRLAKSGATMIVVTHELEFAKEVATKVVFMEDGMIVEQGDTKSMFNNPAKERTRQFFGSRGI